MNRQDVCGTCRHWKAAPDRRHLFPFAERMSAQIGRRVEIGYCHAPGAKGSGPTADGDWCERWSPAPVQDAASAFANRLYAETGGELGSIPSPT